MNIGIFISHSWKHGEHYKKLHEWIFDSSWRLRGIDIEFTNYSIPQDDPIHYAPNQVSLRNAILTEIYKSDVIVIPTGLYATYSKWIQEEIGGANTCGKPILAVKLRGSERKSSIVAEAAKEMVGWTEQSVVDGILSVQEKY